MVGKEISRDGRPASVNGRRAGKALAKFEHQVNAYFAAIKELQHAAPATKKKGKPRERVALMALVVKPEPDFGRVSPP